MRTIAGADFVQEAFREGESPRMSDTRETRAPSVDVWWCDLRRTSAQRRSAWGAATSDEERDRADRFRFPADRERFLARRGFLRSVLAGYAGRRPEALQFARGPNGKPRLPDADIRFNLSRTEDGILLGVTRGPEIGVDVERVRPGYTGEEISGKFFAPAEMASLADLPEGIRSEAFFRVWTAKEAYLKARGEGLGYPLNAFAVPFAGEGPRRLAWHRDDAEIARWWLLPLTPGEGFVGAVAVGGEAPSMVFREVVPS